MVYPNTVITIEYLRTLNDTKPKVGITKNSEMNINFYSELQALPSCTNLLCFISPQMTHDVIRIFLWQFCRHVLRREGRRRRSDMIDLKMSGP